jgi:acetyl esterase/lipase
MEKVLKPAALPVVNALAQECIESIYDIYVRQRTARGLVKAFLSVPNPVDLEPWRSLAADNTLGVLPEEIPVFLSQGMDDNLVRADVTVDYMRRLCGSGASVHMISLPGVGHGFIARDSTHRAVEWISDRFAGAPAPNDCAR